MFVLVGLDASPGAGETAFSRRVGDAAEAAGARVTYFINTQNYLLSPLRAADPRATDDERPWIDPRRGVIRRISYARSLSEIEGRIRSARYLIERGHELASHGVHHERGNRWTVAQWQREFSVFGRFHEERLGLPRVEGFRAPYLSPGSHVGPAEESVGMRYDASHVLQGRVWPRRLRGTRVWQIGVPSIRLRRCLTVIFDGGLQVCRFTDAEAVVALREEFDHRYEGNRAPLVLSSHEGYVEGAYLPLLRQVCGLPDVRCATFAALARYMDAHPHIEGWGRRRAQQDRAPPAHPSP